MLLDQYKNAVGLRGYAQNNPIVEVKSEGFKMFQDMISNWIWCDTYNDGSANSEQSQKMWMNVLDNSKQAISRPTQADANVSRNWL